MQILNVNLRTTDRKAEGLPLSGTVRSCHCTYNFQHVHHFRYSLSTAEYF